MNLLSCCIIPLFHLLPLSTDINKFLLATACQIQFVIDDRIKKHISIFHVKLYIHEAIRRCLLIFLHFLFQKKKKSSSFRRDNTDISNTKQCASKKWKRETFFVNRKLNSLSPIMIFIEDDYYSDLKCTWDLEWVI